MASSANLDLVRSIHAAWERGDYSSAERAHPEIEHVAAEGRSPGSWIGLAGMAQANRDVLSVWENVHQEAEDYRELGSGRVLVLHRFTARGKKSGLALRHMRSEGAACSTSAATR